MLTTLHCRPSITDAFATAPATLAIVSFSPTRLFGSAPAQKMITSGSFHLRSSPYSTLTRLTPQRVQLQAQLSRPVRSRRRRQRPRVRLDVQVRPGTLVRPNVAAQDSSLDLQGRPHARPGVRAPVPGPHHPRLVLLGHHHHLSVHSLGSGSRLVVEEERWKGPDQTAGAWGGG